MIIGWLLDVYFFQVNNVFSAVIVAAVHVDTKAMQIAWLWDMVSLDLMVSQTILRNTWLP